MDLVRPILDKVKCMMVPSCNYVEHHRNLGERMKELTEKLTELRISKEDIEMRKQTEVGSDQEVRKEVEHWLEHAEAIIAEIQKVEQKFQNVKFMCPGCLSKRVLKKIVEVDKILEDGKFPEGIAINKPPARGVILPTDRNVEGDPNRVEFGENLEEKIMRYLMGDDVGIIGVCGPGGVGKTTLAKSINNKLSNLMDPKFDKVIWAPIPYPFSTVKLQDTIASAMKENLPKSGSEEARAAKLFKIMWKVKFLLILDDAWERFSFDDVGIPIPTPENGCKVVITSRSTQLCKQLGCNDKGLVGMETLSEEESFNLFLDTVGRDVIEKIPNLEDTLRDLVKGCAGLPLAIVAIARSLRGEYDISMWRNALNELRTREESVRGWDDEMFERLKFSYDRLNNEELQNCFMFCSLYPKSEDIFKKELIECWIDGGLIKQLKTREAMADRGRAILKRLISDCLIEEVGQDSKHRAQQVRMNDVMRDMALRVAGSRFMVKAGEKLTNITANDEWTEHLEKVSMFGCGMSVISRDFCPNCPKLSTLLLSRNYNLKMIPESFFKGMPSLGYLDLSGTGISALPNSISNLINLTTLQLCNMRELKYVPSLAELKALKKLDLMGAGIEVVPEGIELLVNLQYLDLNCPYLVEFPIQILKDLSHLEFFAANFSSCWSTKDFLIEAKRVPRLKMLDTFFGEFHNLEGFSNYVKFFHQKLTQYVLVVGEINLDTFYKLYHQTTARYKKVIMRRLDLQEEHVSLPNDLQQLEIEECYGVESLSEISLPKTETDLRSCVIASSGLQCILDLGSPSSVCSLFDNCEILRIFNMRELHALVKGATSPLSTSHASLSTPPFTFSNIKEFEISGCPRIKKLFPSKLLKALQNLQKIWIRDCAEMEEIIDWEEDGENDVPFTFRLPKLMELWLWELPKLKRICTSRGVMVCDSIEEIKIFECEMLRRIPLYLPLLRDGRLSPPPLLKEISIDSTEWWESLLWDFPTAKDILNPFLIVKKSDSSFKAGYQTTTFALPKLKVLDLKLPKLKRICDARVIFCDSIEKVSIDKHEMLEPIHLHCQEERLGIRLVQTLLPDEQLSESLQWEKPDVQNILNPFLKFEELDFSSESEAEAESEAEGEVGEVAV